MIAKVSTKWRVEIRNFRSARSRKLRPSDGVLRYFLPVSPRFAGRATMEFSKRLVLNVRNVIANTGSVVARRANRPRVHLPRKYVGIIMALNPRLSFRETRCTINNDKRVSTELPQFAAYQAIRHETRYGDRFLYGEYLSACLPGTKFGIYCRSLASANLCVYNSFLGRGSRIEHVSTPFHPFLYLIIKFKFWFSLFLDTQLLS